MPYETGDPSKKSAPEMHEDLRNVGKAVYSILWVRIYDSSII